MAHIFSTGVVVFFISLCFAAALYHLSTVIIGVKRVLFDICLFACVFSLIQLAFNFFFLYYPRAEAYLSWVWVLIFLIHALFLSALISRRYSESFVKAFNAVALAQFVLSTVVNIVEISLYRVPFLDIVTLFEEHYFLANIIYSGIPHAFAVICSFLMGFIFEKSRFTRYFSHLFSTRISSVIMTLTSFTLMNIHTLLLFADPNLIYSDLFIAASFALIILALFVLQFAAMFTENRERIEAQEQIILQQNAYVHALENLHDDFRNFRHDLRNLLSGITMQVDEGDFEGVKEYLQDTSQYFEYKLGDEIKQMNVLGLIKIPSVKSLLAVKLAIARQQRVNVKTEILYPVEYIGMKEQDFNRCLGILLDNAIESVLPETEPEVQIIILQEPSELRIAISNTCKDCPPIHDIFRRNFSTKGSSHGLGLYSYSQILDSYSNTSNRCFWKDGVFLQELRIRNNMKGV